MDEFASTHWSLVASAGAGGSKDAAQALSKLCHQYWMPLYGYVRRRVPDSHEAQDLTQAFFQHLLERAFFAQADPRRGRFRAFLLTSLKNFLAQERTRTRAQKRGGGNVILATDLSFADGESRLAEMQIESETPEKQFHRQWALALLDQVLSQLRAESSNAGKLRQFELLKPLMAGARTAATDYYAIAIELQMTENAVKMAASRLRQRYRELLRLEVAHTVLDPADLDAELLDLFTALG